MLVKKLAYDLYGVYRACGLTTFLRYLFAMLRSAPQIVKTRTLIPADKHMAGKKWRWKVQGVSITLDGKHFPIARELYGASPSRIIGSA